MIGQKQTVDILIKHGTILPMDSSLQVIHDGAVAVSARRILMVGEAQRIETLVDPRETLDASGMLVMPGLINTHTHSGDALFRGLVEDLPLESWLEKLWVVESKFLNPDSIYWGSQLAYMELILSGVTTAVDMFWFPESLVQAAKKLGMRVMTGPVFFDSSITDSLNHQDRMVRGREFINEYLHNDLIIPCVQPHAVYSVSPENLQQAGELAHEFGVHFVTHASETETEVRNSIRDFCLSPIKHLDRLGLLGERTVLAHCVHLQDDEFELLSKRGSVVSHCPMSNLKIASGIANVSLMMESGVKVTLGTDGPVSGNDLNPWFTMRLTPVLQRAIHKNTVLLPAPLVVQMATQKAAQALGLDDQIGSLEPGKLADILLIRTGKAHSRPVYDPYALLVYNIGREDVDTVLINGKIIARQRQLMDFDVQELNAHINQISQQVSQFLGIQMS
jgi:5-methylthioadenosine/S-adenosylhomocysteine deaminase